MYTYPKKLLFVLSSVVTTEMLLKTNCRNGRAAGGHNILSPKKLKNKEQFLIPRAKKRTFSLAICHGSPPF